VVAARLNHSLGVVQVSVQEEEQASGRVPIPGHTQQEERG